MRSARLIQVLLPLFLVMLLFGAGCSGKHELVKGAPDWVNEGSGAFENAGDKVFYGVGSVTGVQSLSLSRETAEQRARAEVARQLHSYVTSLYRDYQVATGIGQGKAPLEEQHIDGTLKNLSQVTVRGAKVIEFWREPKTDTLYALARTDLTAMKSAIAEMREVDPQFRDYVNLHAEEAFTNLDQQAKEVR
ncbi:MAG: LPP20 family lipoprotein [Desulfuromonadales bacterium]|nr:LPP20 family lipoprotein [Desulfuromonadales bacterium]